MFALAAVAVLALLRLRPFRVEVHGESMRPTLEPGDWCIATRGGHVKRGDVVVLERPDQRGFELVKRVTGVPGEEGLGFDEWFVEGDDPSASTDSRHFGPVHRDAIRGRVRLVYWPRWRRLRSIAGPGSSPPR